jgi:hypothetical protein
MMDPIERDVAGGPYRVPYKKPKDVWIGEGDVAVDMSQIVSITWHNAGNIRQCRVTFRSGSALNMVQALGEKLFKVYRLWIDAQG